MKLALATTVLLFPMALPVALWLARTRSRLRHLVRAVLTLPLVLPPTVLGYYLLLLYSPALPPGRWLEAVFDMRLAFSFPGLVLASILFNIPFMVNPLLAGMESLPPSLWDQAAWLGKGRVETLLRILLPNLLSPMAASVLLCFAHCLGEFGVVLMIGGKIPGVGRTASVALYDAVEGSHPGLAHFYALVLAGVSLAALLLLSLLNRRSAFVA